DAGGGDHGVARPARSRRGGPGQRPRAQPRPPGLLRPAFRFGRRQGGARRGLCLRYPGRQWEQCLQGKGQASGRGAGGGVAAGAVVPEEPGRLLLQAVVGETHPPGGQRQGRPVREDQHGRRADRAQGGPHGVRRLRRPLRRRRQALPRPACRSEGPSGHGGWRGGGGGGGPRDRRRLHAGVRGRRGRQGPCRRRPLGDVRGHRQEAARAQELRRAGLVGD
ncbi:hypothetical protein ACJX0J_015272, partial [Zea mays]